MSYQVFRENIVRMSIIIIIYLNVAIIGSFKTHVKIYINDKQKFHEKFSPPLSLFLSASPPLSLSDFYTYKL